MSGNTRAGAAPDIPATTTEEPGFKNPSYNFWIGMVAPARTPPEILKRLYAETRKALAVPAVRDKLVAFGVDLMN